MNRRNFLRGLAAIVPATLLAKIALPTEAAIVEAVEETPAREYTPLRYQGMAFEGRVKINPDVLRPSATHPNKWITIGLDDE